jgi:transcriptional regulator with XRE-family HTH domain
MNTAGDLGRRVMERRLELGLNLEDVATRAGMSTTYLRALEASPSPELPRAALWRLAAALETSVDFITGSGMDEPPGRAGPPDRPLLESLSVDECRALVAPGGVGRVVFSNDRGPVALPVNFRMLADNVVFRTEPDSDLLSILPNGGISFEIDHLDEALTEGWSVLLSGDGRAIVDPSEYEQVESLGIAPWAGGRRDTYVVLVPIQVTGRRIRRRSVHE